MGFIKAMYRDQLMNSSFMGLLVVTLFFLVSCNDATPIIDESVSIPSNEPVEAFTPQPIDNFNLLDHTGKSHELFYYSDAKAIVIMIHGNGCPIVRNSVNDYMDLSKKYRGKKVRFFMLNSNLQVSCHHISLK